MRKEAGKQNQTPATAGDPDDGALRASAGQPGSAMADSPSSPPAGKTGQNATADMMFGTPLPPLPKNRNMMATQTTALAIIRAINRKVEPSGDSLVGWKILVWKLTINLTLFIKRFVDLLVAVLALVILSPVLGVILVLIRLGSDGPAIYTQVRIGKDGKPFLFYKFRSMYKDAERIKAELMNRNESGDGVLFKMKRDPRVTPIGRVLRKCSLDELPQLANVLLGDMSLVGPRPPLPAEVAQYTLEERKRLHVLPGITCLWQISGRSDIPFKEQVRLDNEYIRSQGFWSDLVILLKTIPAVLSGKGAY